MSNAVVAAGHPLTAKAAAEVLRNGGNAFDAAIAALYAVPIAEPALASMGGGGFLMAYPNDDKPILFDFFVQTPTHHKATNEIDSRSFICDFGSTQQEFIIGAGTSAVPGYVKGIFEVAKRFSTLPMIDLITPALDMLRDGIVVNDMQAHIFKILTPIYLSNQATHIYESKRNPGNTVSVNEKLFFPQLDDLLETLAIEGEALFYQGEIAKAIDEIGQIGGLIRYEDMVKYQVELRHPLKITYQDHQLLLNPPPSNSGIILALAMTHLNELNLGQYAFGSTGHLTQLLSVLKMCSKLDDTSDCELLPHPNLRELYRSIRLLYPSASRGTTHISIIDRYQNAASVSISNGEGCGTLIPNTAVMLNNMLGEHDVNPDGLNGWPANRRLSSMMSPTIAKGPNNSLIATGSGGSNRIPAILQQILVNLLDFNMSVESAVQSPRLHFYKGDAYGENLFGNSELLEILHSFGQATIFENHDVFFGGAHTVKQSNIATEGAGDVRRGGVSILV